MSCLAYMADALFGHLVSDCRPSLLPRYVVVVLLVVVCILLLRSRTKQSTESVTLIYMAV
jgi:hypothetical protein